MNVLSRFLDRSATGPTIEPMRHRHIGQVLAIERAVYPKPWTAKVFHDELDQVRPGHRHYVVARSGRQVIGYAGLMFVLEEAHVTNIAVHPEHRRYGVGKQLLLDLAETAVRRNCESWTLEVRASSTGAQALYRSFGFVPAGIRKGYYEGVEDAIVMWCHDIRTPDYARLLGELS